MRKYNIHPLSLLTDGELVARLDLVYEQLEELIAQSLRCQNAEEAKVLLGKVSEKRSEMTVYIDALEEIGHDCSGVILPV
ncbi:hypothetical protein K3H35_13125 [Aeromonas veronii]|uniref:hypothetical protein n=1 Tax=Aeromonas TaxID=642 RepID=UPI0011186C23|nr:hypothetical protein [Aeromonas veronii]MCF5909729.1 hypothetical protein [Aeromonas veronii]MCX0420864.1 hypothetical protein [Aeromonas veronii]TNI74261.1 hypothetical protein CF109_07490 [Aeromonas veronii]WIJ40685.1 hypothetical protein QPK06_16725 [Aeromonas veronii]